MAVTSFAPAAAGLQQYEKVFTSSGTWTKPASVKTAEITILGGGGCTISGQSGAGGAGGYYKGIFDVSGLSSATVTVGAGATFNTARGGDSSVGNLVIAKGGYSYNSNYSTIGAPSGEVVFPTSTTTKNLTIVATNNQSITNQSNGSHLHGSLAYGNGIAVQTVSAYSYWSSQYRTSTDNFQSSVIRTLPDQTAYNVQVFFVTDPADSVQKFFLFSDYGLRKSTDGINWTSATQYSNANGFGWSNNSAIQYANGYFVNVRGSSNVFRSTDGITWTLTSAAYNIPTWNFKAVNGVFFAFSESGDYRVYYSVNGQTWTYVTAGGYYPQDVEYFNGEYYIASRWSNTNIYKYTLSAGTLTYSGELSGGSYSGNLAVDRVNNIFYRIMDGWLYYSTDGTSWGQVPSSNIFANQTSGWQTGAYIVNGTFVFVDSNTGTHTIRSVLQAFGITGFSGRGSSNGGGSVGPAEYWYSYQNYGFAAGTQPITNDPLLIGCGLGGLYVGSYDKYRAEVYQAPRYGSGGYGYTNGSPSYSGGNGIVIIRWWA